MNYVLARSASRATLSLFRPTTRIVNGQGRPEGLPPFVQTDDRRRFHFIAHGGTTVRSVVLRCVLGFRTDTCSLTTRPHAWRAGTTFARCLQRAFCSQCKRQRQRVGARDFLSAPLESHCEDGSKPPRPAWTPPLARAFSSDLDPASRAVLSQAGPPKKMRTGYAMSASIGDKKPNNGEEEEAMPPSTIGSIGPGGGGPAGPGAGDDSKKPPSHRGGPKGGDPPGPPSYAPTDEGVADVTEVKISRREADKVIVPPFPKVTQEVHQQQDKERRNASSTRRTDRAVGIIVLTNTLIPLHLARVSQKQKPRQRLKARQKPSLSQSRKHFRQLRLFDFAKHGILSLRQFRSGTSL